MTQDAAPNAPTAVLPSTCTLYLEDCLTALPKLQNSSIHLCFADLPYGLFKNHWDYSIDLNNLWPRLQATAADNAAFIFTATSVLAARLITSREKLYKYDLIWHKNRPSGFLNSKKQPLRSHEQVLYFAQGKPPYNPQMRKNETGRVQSAKEKAGLSSLYSKRVEIPAVRGKPMFPLSIISPAYPDKERGLHNTQKPVALLEWLIKTYTNPGDTVLDPVFGSATTGIACARFGRHFIGIEKDPEYFRIGRERVDAERAKLGLQPCKVIE